MSTFIGCHKIIKYKTKWFFSCAFTALAYRINPVVQSHDLFIASLYILKIVFSIYSCNLFYD